MRRRRRLVELAPAITSAAARALYSEANDIINDSQRLIPVDTGTAKASARVFEPVIDANHVMVKAGYGYGDSINPTTGQPASGYVVPLHERLDVAHVPPTQAKFLELPAQEHARTFAGRIALEIQRVLRGRQAA